jgi:acyl-coenzyme A thioesterase PaaI-like protein
MKASTLRWAMNLWPTFLFSGIRVATISADFRHVRVELRQHRYNRNYVGSHFGGSLFAMADPFRMIPLLRVLGRDYIVWDQASHIEFLKPGRGTVSADFHLDDAVVAEIRAATAGGEKHLHWFDTDLLDAQGDVVARVRKQVYVRRKRPDEAGGR